MYIIITAMSLPGTIYTGECHNNVSWVFGAFFRGREDKEIDCVERRATRKLCWILYNNMLGKRLQSYLQVGYRCGQRRWIFPQQSLFIKELSSSTIKCWLEESIIQNVLQAVVEGAQDALFGHPNWSIRVQPEALLIIEKKKKLELDAFQLFLVLSFTRITST